MGGWVPRQDREMLIRQAGVPCQNSLLAFVITAAAAFRQLAPLSCYEKEAGAARPPALSGPDCDWATDVSCGGSYKGWPLEISQINTVALPEFRAVCGSVCVCVYMHLHVCVTFVAHD